MNQSTALKKFRHSSVIYIYYKYICTVYTFNTCVRIHIVRGSDRDNEVMSPRAHWILKMGVRRRGAGGSETPSICIGQEFGKSGNRSPNCPSPSRLPSLAAATPLSVPSSGRLPALIAPHLKPLNHRFLGRRSLSSDTFYSSSATRLH